MRTLPLAELVEDFDIYPRHAVDDGHVSSLVNAIKAGVTLPPIVIERKSKRITDGWHRSRAYRRVLGPEGVVDVEEVDYVDEAELLTDAIRRNASHGRKLDVIDQVRAIALGQERGISLHTMAIVLHLPDERVQKLSVRLAQSEKTGPGTIPGTVSVALKRPVAHLVGQTFNEAQMEAHGRAPGTSYLLTIRQLLDAVTCEFINRHDERLMAELRILHTAIGEFLNPKN